MDDTTVRELLTWAAKAAGYEAIRPSTFSDDIYLVLSEGEWQPWNPHTEDGDALRLAVRLRIVVQHEPRYVVAIFIGPARDREIAAHEDNGIDPYAATRRAIVCAAAAIGKAMP